MGTRGVLFAIAGDDAQRLLAASGDDAVMGVIEEIEEAWEEPFLAETESAWDAMHRALTDGKLAWANGSFPLNHAILGGQDLYEGDDYIAVLKTPDQVREVAGAVRAIDDVAMADLYDRNVPHDYDPNYGDDDRHYTVELFSGVRELFERAAAAGRWVIFTASQ